MRLIMKEQRRRPWWTLYNCCFCCIWKTTNNVFNS